MKLAIGTVQFGIHYGINNQMGIPNDEEVHRIFNLAKNNTINILDTAPAYGNSQERVAKFSTDYFKIVSKFSKVKTDIELLDSLNSSLNSLKLNSIYGYIAHQADDLISNPSLWKVLLDQKRIGKIRKIGYSLYFPEQLQQLLDLDFIPDLVQLPYSLLDRKFEKSLSSLKNVGSEIHVRSVFLQGLYFMNPKNLPEKLMPLSEGLIRLHEISVKLDIDIGTMALKFVELNPFIDFVVVGVDSTEQLIANIEMVKKNIDYNYLKHMVNQIDVSNKELLNPTNW